MFVPSYKCSFEVCIYSLCCQDIANQFSAIYYKNRDQAVFTVDHGSFTVFYRDQVIRSQTVVDYGLARTDLLLTADNLRHELCYFRGFHNRSIFDSYPRLFSSCIYRYISSNVSKVTAPSLPCSNKASVNPPLEKI